MIVAVVANYEEEVTFTLSVKQYETEAKSTQSLRGIEARQS